MSEHRQNLYQHTNDQMTMQRPPFSYQQLQMYPAVPMQNLMDYSAMFYTGIPTAHPQQFQQENAYFQQFQQQYRPSMPQQQLQQPQAQQLNQVEMKPNVTLVNQQVPAQQVTSQPNLMTAPAAVPQPQQPRVAPREKKPLALFDMGPEKTPTKPMQPEQVKIEQPKPVEPHVQPTVPAPGGAKSNILFKVPADEEIDPPVAKVEPTTPEAAVVKEVPVVAEPPVMDDYNEWFLRTFNEKSAPYKTKDTCDRIKYSYDEMVNILSNPCVLDRVEKNTFADTRKIVQKNSHARMKLPGFTFDIHASNIEKVEGAYVPSHLKDKQDSVAPEKQLLKDLNAILNRLMEGNLAVSLDEIRQLNVTTPQNLPLLARAVFEMAIKQTKFAKAFAKLTRAFWDSQEFKREMIEILQSRIEKPIEKHVEEANAGVDAELAKVTDETRRKILEERRETVMLKAEEAYFGTMTFMAELYTAELFSVLQLINILRRFVGNLTQNSAKSLTIILGIAGKRLDQQERGKMDELYRSFEAALPQAQLPSYTIYHVELLFKKRQHGWQETDMRPTVYQTKEPESKKSQQPLNSLSSINPTNLSLAPQSGNLKPTIKWNTGCNSAPQSKAAGRKTQPASMAPAPVAYSSERHQEELKELQKHGDPVSLFTSKDATYQESFQRSYKPAFVHHVVDLMMNKKREDRLNAGDMFAQLMMGTPPLTGEDLVEGFKQFSKIIDDYLEDCPLLFDYFADIFHRLLLAPAAIDCTFLVPMLREMNANTAEKRGATVLLQTIQAAVQAAPETQLASRFSRNIRGMITQQLGVSDPELAKLCATYSCAFLLECSPKNSPSVEQAPPRHSMPPGVHQNGSRPSGLPPTSTWASASQPVPQIAQRPPQPAPATPVPTLVKTQPPPPAPVAQASQDDGWLSNTKKKGKGRGQDRTRPSVPPSQNMTPNDVIQFLDTAKNVPPAGMLRERLEMLSGDLQSILPAFSQKLLQRVCGFRKDDLRPYLELLQSFRLARLENQMTLLGVLNQISVKPECRRNLLDTIVDQKCVSIEAIKKWIDEAGDKSPLAGMLKTKFEL